VTSTGGGPPGPRLGRRALVVGAAAAVVAGAGTELANLATGTPTAAPQAAAIPPDVDLMAEHGVLKRALLVYQQAVRVMGSGQAPPWAAIHGAATVIHEFIEEFHEPLEEGYVFPRLRRAGRLVATVDTLLVQHGRGRELTQLVLDLSRPRGLATSAAKTRVTGAIKSFVRMYEPHEAREDTVVFPAFRALAGPAELADLAGRFAALQRAQFGPDAFAHMVDRVAGVERTLGIYDLDEFTPAPVAPL
jgi:hemerythrin-like domain-containing protein